MRDRKTYHIKDLVYGATDGIITTFAVVAGVVGGGLATSVILIVGFANLLADGFSMAASNYLGTKSEHEVLNTQGIKESSEQHHPLVSGLLTFAAFVVAGFIPLLPFIFMGEEKNAFTFCLLATGLALFIVGASRSVVTKKSSFRSGLEILVIGGLAAVLAYFVGHLIRILIG